MIIFVKPSRVSDGYHDLWTLVDLAGFQTVRSSDIDLASHNMYLLVSQRSEVENEEWSQYVGGPRNCRLIWWCFEPLLSFPNRTQIIDDFSSIVDRIWVSDRYIASLDPRLSFATLGGDARLGMPPLSPEFDFTLLGTVVSRTINGVERSPRKTIIDDLQKRGLRMGRGDWEIMIDEGRRRGAGDWDTALRGEMLRRTRLMINVSQHDVPTTAPLRFALAAAFRIPVIAQLAADPYPYNDCVSFVPYDQIINRTSELLADEDRCRSLANALHQKLCHEWTFRRGVEQAIAENG